MAFKMGSFSSRNRNADQDPGPNSEFGEAGDSQFMHGEAGGPATPAAESGYGADGAPLRLRDALGRLGTRVAPAETGPGFKLPLIGHLPAQRQLSVLSTALAISLGASAVFVAFNTVQSANRSAQTQVASDALMHSQRIGKAAPNAVQGSAEASANWRKAAGN